MLTSSFNFTVPLFIILITDQMYHVALRTLCGNLFKLCYPLYFNKQWYTMSIHKKHKLVYKTLFHGSLVNNPSFIHIIWMCYLTDVDHVYENISLSLPRPSEKILCFCYFFRNDFKGRVNWTLSEIHPQATIISLSYPVHVLLYRDCCFKLFSWSTISHRLYNACALKHKN